MVNHRQGIQAKRDFNLTIRDCMLIKSIRAKLVFDSLKIAGIYVNDLVDARSHAKERGNN